MPYSRRSRLEETKEKKRLTMAIFGIVGILLFVVFFGVKVLIGFSVLVDRIRGSSPAIQNQTLLLPPTLDPPPLATNSATISLTGRGTPKLTVLIYLNDAQIKKMPVPDDGKFTIAALSLSSGTNTISAKLMDEKEATSDISNIVTVMFANKPPKLDVADPEDNRTITGEPNTVLVQGVTDDNVAVTVNDRVVVVKSDNSFSYNYSLSEGDNILNIVATDSAGNQTKITRRVTYRR